MDVLVQKKKVKYITDTEQETGCQYFSRGGVQGNHSNIL